MYIFYFQEDKKETRKKNRINLLWVLDECSVDVQIDEMIVIDDDNLLIKMFSNFDIFVSIMMEEFSHVISPVKHSMLLIYYPKKEEKIL
jgi:hypothetical protein